MKHVILAAALALPLAAQAETEGEIEEGFSLMEEGARLLFQGLMSEMEPALDELADKAGELEPALEMLASEMGPALMEIMRTIDSVRHYEAPEILPNGDIIIRRSPDAPDYEVAEDDEVVDL